MLLDEKNGAEWDLSPCEQDHQTYFIATTPRTGSTLLCQALWQTGDVGAPKEYLNPMQLRDWEVRLGNRGSQMVHRHLQGPLLSLVGRGWTAAKIRRHLIRVRTRRTCGGWFGLKIHAHHFKRWNARLDMKQHFGSIQWIHLYRTDRVAQAVSWARALQTGVWVHSQQKQRTPRYNRHLIAWCLSAIDRGERFWKDWFESHHIQPLQLQYHQLTEDLLATTRAVTQFLNIPRVTHTGRPIPILKRQGDAINTDWIARFIQDAKHTTVSTSTKSTAQ